MWKRTAAWLPMLLLIPVLTLTFRPATGTAATTTGCKAKLPLWRYKSAVRLITKARLERKQFVRLNANVSICEVDRHLGVSPPRFPKGEPQKWVKVTARQVRVFSAFHERRAAAGGPAVRIVASGWQEQFHDIGELHCRMWYRNRKFAVSVQARYVRIYPSTMHSLMWVAHFIMCPLPVLDDSAGGDRKSAVAGVPYAVQVLPVGCASGETEALLVLNRKPVSRRRDGKKGGGGVALCAPPLYGNFRNWTMVVEMFELQTLLGVDEITIYEHKTHISTHLLLRSYVSDASPRVNVVPWGSLQAGQTSVFSQRAAINDCLYRMAHTHEYVIITDLDEVLVPRMTSISTLPMLLASIARPEYGAYLFQHAYFRRNYSAQAQQEAGLITQSSFWRTDVVTPPGKIRCKALYRAAQAVSLDLHFAYALVPGALEYMVEPEEGMLHHYRCDPMQQFTTGRYHFIEDRHMEVYKHELTKRFKAKVVKAIKPVTAQIVGG